jgi:uncharacterized membrane protein (DUF106 family)
MSYVNAVLRAVVGGCLYPFRGLNPLVGLSVVSLVTSIALLLVIKKTSNQKALEAAKRKIYAGIFEIVLFNDDFRAIFRAQLDIFRHNLTYLRYSMAPMIWTLPPIILLIAQLQFHYGYEGLDVGRTTLMKVSLEKGSYSEGEKPDLRIEAPDDAIQVVGPSLWIPSLGEMDFRIAPKAPGDYEIRVSSGSETTTKSIHVSDGVRTVQRSPLRVRGFLDELLYPAEPPLPEGPFRSIEVKYEDADIDVFGWEIHWMIVYFALSIVFALALKGPFKVTI